MATDSRGKVERPGKSNISENRHVIQSYIERRISKIRLKRMVFSVDTCSLEGIIEFCSSP